MQVAVHLALDIAEVGCANGLKNVILHFVLKYNNRIGCALRKDSCDSWGIIHCLMRGLNHTTPGASSVCGFCIWDCESQGR